MECFTADFLFLTKKRQGFWVDGLVHASKSRCFSYFLEISEFPNSKSNPNSKSPNSNPKSYVVRQLVHSLFGDNNLFPFHLWWREIVLNSKKVYKCFVQDWYLLSRFIIMKVSWLCMFRSWNSRDERGGFTPFPQQRKIEGCHIFYIIKPKTLKGLIKKRKKNRKRKKRKI